MVNILRKAKADVRWWCEVSDGRDFGPVYATIQALDEYENIPTQDLNDWANSKTSILLAHICDASCAVFGDSIWCGFHEILGDPYDIKQTPPTIPADVRGNIEIILKAIKENTDDIDYIQELNRELDILLERNNLTRDDIRNLM